MRLYFLLIIIFVSCSGSTIKKIKDKFKKPKKVEVTKTKPISIDYGPSQKKDTIFVDVTDQLGLSNVVSVRNYIVDVNGDGLEDLVVLPDYYSTPEFYLKLESGKFSKSKSVFFEDSVKASFLSFDDFDKDGNLDVLVGVFNQKTSLTQRPLSIYSQKSLRGSKVFIKNEKFNFDQVLPIPTIATLDFNYDGFLDFYMGTWFDLKENGKVIPDALVIRQKDKMKDATGILLGEEDLDANIYINATPTYGVSHCDVNNDGLIDILVSASAGYKNKLWIGEAGKKGFRFTNRATEAGFSDDKEGFLSLKGGGNSTYSLCTDYNNDGIMDIAQGEVSHDYDPETRDRSSILTGEGLKRFSSFVRSEYISDGGKLNWTESDQRATWFDINNDAFVDLLIENSGYPPSTRMILFQQEKTHELVEISKKAGLDIVNPIGSVVFDHNNDGKMDIIVSRTDLRDKRIKKRLYVFENRSLNKNNFIKVFLEGTKSNSSAIGARVIVRDTSGIVQTRWVHGPYGAFPSGHSRVLHFGLGSADIYEIEVVWPMLENNIAKRTIYKKPFLKINSKNILIEQ